MAARGRRKKNISLEEELASLTEEMDACEAKIKELTDKKKQLRQQIEKKQMEALYQAALDSGKSIEETISLIHGNNGDKEQDF